MEYIAPIVDIILLIALVIATMLGLIAIFIWMIRKIKDQMFELRRENSYRKNKKGDK